MGVIRLGSDKDELREMVRAFLSAFAFVLAVAIATALVCGLTGCAQNGQRTGELVVDENPPAPLQTRTYDMELDGYGWTATKVYDATSGRSWWLLRRVNSSNYIVLEVGGNVPVG